MKFLRVFDLEVGTRIFYHTLPWYFAEVLARNWIVVIISLERFAAIIEPFWSLTYVTKRRLLYVIIVVILVAIGLAILKYLGLNYKTCAVLGRMSLEISDLDRYEDFYFYSIFIALIPLFSMRTY